MKMLSYAATVVFVLLSIVAEGRAQEIEMSETPKPQKEHEWLQRFVGKWTSDAQCTMGPDQPPMECEGTQQARMLGGFWMIAEGKSEVMGQRVQSVLTIGFDPKKNHYVGSWIDTCQNHMWQYVGTLNDEGNVLTLETEGPNMLKDGEQTKYREVIEFKSDDHYVFTSSMEGEDGKFVTFMTANFHRAK